MTKTSNYYSVVASKRISLNNVKDDFDVSILKNKIVYNLNVYDISIKKRLKFIRVYIEKIIDIPEEDFENVYLRETEKLEIQLDEIVNQFYE